jgi:hypothetical protein
MWFAALGSYEQNPWLVNLAYKMLMGSPNAYGLLASDNEFSPMHPPKCASLPSLIYLPLKPSNVRLLQSLIVL